MFCIKSEQNTELPHVHVNCQVSMVMANAQNIKIWASADNTPGLHIIIEYEY